MIDTETDDDPRRRQEREGRADEMTWAFLPCRSPVRCVREGGELAPSLELTRTLFPGGPPRRRWKRLHRDHPRRADPRPPGRCAFQNTGPGAVRTGSDFRLSLRSKICIALWFQALIWSEKGAEVHLIIKFPCENIPFFFFFLRRTHSCIRKSFLGPSKHLRD